ncbi:MAG: PKD domain-containing protein [Acidobacteria bacterium]|nr:PKD domain-containing protein [Acidobacteriota bacterium]
MNSATPILSRIAVGLAAAISLPAAATAQQLWSIEEVTAQPLSRIVINGMAVSAAAAGNPTTAAAEVRVEFDYLRLGMGYLELPLPDGSMIAAENAVFEDRGGGNLMWTGEVPGAGYESVLFTVQDGYLVGWFGEPGGPKYVVYAGPDGSGSLAVEVGPAGDWCAAGTEPAGDLVRDVAAAANSQGSVAAQSSDDRLNILTLYTTGTERFWRVIGGPAMGVQQLADYLNMALRNGAIKETANLIPVRWDPKHANHPRTQGFHFRRGKYYESAWHYEFGGDSEVETYRRRHMPDLVHFIPDVGFGSIAGAATVRRSLDPYVLTGWSLPFPGTFAHEIGHNLGGNHEPATFGDRFEEVQSWEHGWHGWPYSFGHTDLTSCAKREGHGDQVFCPMTIMSYGQDLRDDPDRYGSKEPFYSSVRHKPNGWTIGVAGTSEVERAFHETVSVAAISGEEPWRSEQHPRRVTGVRWTGHDTVRVTWSEDWRSQDGGQVRLELAEGAYDVYRWLWDYGSNRDDPPLYEGSDANVTPLVRADGSQVGVEVSGLRPGGGYRLAVRGPERADLATQTNVAPLPSDIFHLKPRGRVSDSPAAASQIDARVTGPDSVRLYWRDNSGVETGYEVWYRKWSGEKPGEIWSRFGEPLPARTRYVDVEGLAVEEGIQVTEGYHDSRKRTWVPGQTAKIGRYSFVIVAYNDKGWNASETFHLEFMPERYPEPTAPGENTDCYVRTTGIGLDGYQVDACLETSDGSRRRAWDYQLEADQSGLLYFFDRDDAEILVKVLDGCAINGHRWVFVAPVTTLPFRVQIAERGPYIANRRQTWYYDSERRPQEQIHDRAGNPKDRTARTVSDTTAFPCTTAEIAAAKAAASGSESESGFGPADLPPAVTSPVWLSAGSSTDCEPNGTALTLLSGYRVSMCYETEDGETGEARDWGLESNRMGLLYFSDRDLVDVLIKVQDNCAANGNVSVFVAPATEAAFNLHVESPDGQVWTHTNRLGQTADSVSDISAFPCAGAPPVSVSFATSRYEVSEGETVRIAVRLSEDPGRDLAIPLVLTHLGGATDADYSDVPDWVTFSNGVTTREFEFAATSDSDVDDGEFVVVGIERLPLGVSGGGQTTVAIRDAPPMASFAVEGVDCGLELCRAVTDQVVRFVDRSSGAIQSWRWDFGDGVGATYTATADHEWLEPGFYDVKLRVSDGVRESETSRTFLVEASDPAGTCEPDHETLCLGDSRYRVRARWRTGGDAEGQASVAHAGTNDSGLFWFFDRENWEMLIKVLDGCAVNGNVWVFGASTTDLGYTISVTDTVTGAVKVYRNQPGKPAPAITDSRAFPASCSANAGAAATAFATSVDPVSAAPPSGSPSRLESLDSATRVGQPSHGACVDAPWALCPQDGRYEVVVWWQSTPGGEYNLAQRAPARTRDSGLYSFFDPNNWEMLIKVLDGCAVNGQHWVYAASATDLGFQIRVTDTETHARWLYTKQPGKPAEAVTDSEAFPDACRR